MGRVSRVLVVDDEPAIRALVAKIVERAGHPVDTARDGAEAIQKLEETDYGVIVLDLMMPNIDGYGLIQHLKGRPGTKPAVIVVSAGDSGALTRLVVAQPASSINDSDRAEMRAAGLFMIGSMR